MNCLICHIFNQSEALISLPSQLANQKMWQIPKNARLVLIQLTLGSRTSFLGIEDPEVVELEDGVTEPPLHLPQAGVLVLRLRPQEELFGLLDHFSQHVEAPIFGLDLFRALGEAARLQAELNGKFQIK